VLEQHHQLQMFVSCDTMNKKGLVECDDRLGARDMESGKGKERGKALGTVSAITAKSPEKRRTRHGARSNMNESRPCARVTERKHAYRSACLSLAPCMRRGARSAPRPSRVARPRFRTRGCLQTIQGSMPVPALPAWARRHRVLEELLRVCASRPGGRERLVSSCLV
jgi:hypothetical protein